MDGDKGEEKAETWILNLSVEDLDRLDGLERARRLKTEECSKDKDKPQQKVDGDFLHYLFCKEKLTGKKMVRWADFEDWHKKMSPVKPPQLEAEVRWGCDHADRDVRKAHITVLSTFVKFQWIKRPVVINHTLFY